MKKIVRSYKTFGKGDGDHLIDQYIIEEDTPETRKAILEEYSHCDDIECSGFVEMESNSFYYSTYGGDWDDPTGGYLFIASKEELIEGIVRKSMKEQEEIIELFK